MFDYEYRWNQLAELKFGLFVKEPEIMFRELKKDHIVNPGNQSINKAICCIIQGIREGFIRLIEQKTILNLDSYPMVDQNYAQ